MNSFSKHKISLIYFFIIFGVLFPNLVWAKKKIKEEETSTTEQNSFSLRLNLVTGERSRENKQEFTVVQVRDDMMSLHQEYQGRPIKNKALVKDLVYKLSPEQKQALISKLEELGLKTNLNEENQIAGQGEYVSMKLEIEDGTEKYDTKIKGLLSVPRQKTVEALSKESIQIKDQTKQLLSFLEQLTPQKTSVEN